MEKNCILLIDCFDDFELVDKVIEYIIKYKPICVVNAGYSMILWAPVRGTELTLNDFGQVYGLFDCIGDHTLHFNSRLTQYLNKVNIPIIDIIFADKFIEYAISNGITSTTIMGSSWGNCLHTRELGINNLPKLLPKGMRFLTYPEACVHKTDDPTVIYQIKRDNKWSPLSDNDEFIWEFTDSISVTEKLPIF